MTLDVQGVNLITPLLGDMPDLESLSLRRFNTVLAGLLDRCSAMRSLSISHLHLDSITINLPLLEELVLSAMAPLRRVVVIAPSLRSWHLRPGRVSWMVSSCTTWHQMWRISHGNAVTARHVFALVTFGA